MSTPRTDGQIYWNALPQLATSAEIVYASFARELERDNQTMRGLLIQALPFIERWHGAMENPKMPLLAEMRDCLQNDKLTHPERTPK